MKYVLLALALMIGPASAAEVKNSLDCGPRGPTGLVKTGDVVADSIALVKAEEASKLVGLWKVVEETVLWLDTNEVMHPHGLNLVGYTQFTPGGHIMNIVTESPLPKAAGQGYTEAERANIHKKIVVMVAGTYEVEGNKYIAHIETS